MSNSCNPEVRTTARTLNIHTGVATIVRIIPWLIMAFGAAIRLWQYLHNRSLWNDEAAIARNLIDKSFLELFNPLDFNQAAPVLFLQIEKAFATLFGPYELVLRFFPLAGSLIGLWLLYRVGLMLFDKRDIWFPVALAAFSYRLVYYAQEIKPYGTDAAIALALMLWAFHFLGKEKISAKDVLTAAVIGALSFWLSFPAVFMIASIGTSFIVQAFQKRDREYFNKTAIIFLLWLTGFAPYFVISLSHYAEHKNLLRFWSDKFLPFPTSATNIRDAFDLMYRFVEYAGFKAVGMFIVLPLFLAGTFGALRIFKARGLVLALPFFFTAAASMFHLYPFSGRLLVFLIPVFIILASLGLFLLCEKQKGLAIALGLLTIIVYGQTAYARLVNPIIIERQELKPLLRILLDEKKTDESVYVIGDAQHVVRYYCHVMNADDNEWIYGKFSSHNRQSKFLKDDIGRIGNCKKIWLILSSFNASVLDRLIVEADLMHGQCIRRYESFLSRLLLYDFSSATEAAP